MDNLLNAMVLWRPCVQESPSTGLPWTNEGAIVCRVILIWGAAGLAYKTTESACALAAIFIVPLVQFKIERWRAARVVDKIAVHRFSNEIPVDREVINHLSGHLSAVNKLPPLTLEQQDKYQKLLEIVISNHNVKDNEWSPIYKALIDKGVQLSYEAMRGLLRRNDFDSILYALEKGAIKPCLLTPKQQLKCWLCVQDSRAARLLKQHGFDINIEVDGHTPLMKLLVDYTSINIVSDSFPPFKALLRNGASLPDKNFLIFFKYANLTIFKMLTDADALRKKGPFSEFDLQAVEAPRFSFFSPAFLFKNSLLPKRPNNYRFNIELVALRALAINLVALKFLAASITTSNLPLVYLSIFCMSVFYVFFEHSRSKWFLNELVLQEFQTMFPAVDCVSYIAKNVGLLEQLFAQKIDLDKLDERGFTLWYYACSLGPLCTFEPNLEAFKKLADQLFKTESMDKKKEYFLEAVRVGKLECVKYLLEEKIQAKDFSEAEQFECWRRISDSAAASVLKNKGFNINARNQKGYTPLLHCLTDHYIFRHIDLVQFYLTNGADIHAFVEVEPGVQNSRITVEALVKNNPNMVDVANYIDEWLHTDQV